MNFESRVVLYHRITWEPFLCFKSINHVVPSSSWFLHLYDLSLIKNSEKPIYCWNHWGCKFAWFQREGWYKSPEVMELWWRQWVFCSVESNHTSFEFVNSFYSKFPFWDMFPFVTKLLHSLLFRSTDIVRDLVIKTKSILVIKLIKNLIAFN